MSTSNKKIVICGGGVIGASIAYHLSLRGAVSTIIERADIACAASGKAGGFLAFDWCDDIPLKQLARKSFELHAQLAQTLPTNYEYRRVDTLQVSVNAQNKSHKKNNSLPDWLNGEHISNAESIGTTSTTAQCHPYKFTHALVEAAKKNGSTVRIGIVKGIEVKNNKVEGVKVDDEVIPADVVIIAMGPWSSEILKQFSLPPLKSCKAHSVTFQPTSPISAHTLFLDYINEKGERSSPEVYPRITNEVYICGKTEDVPLPNDPKQIQPSEDKCEELQSLAKVLSIPLKDAPLTKKQACYLPISPDETPLIGKIPNIEGGFIATGHSCWGILNAPATGFALTELILDGKSSIDLTPFDPIRFTLNQ